MCPAGASGGVPGQRRSRVRGRRGGRRRPYLVVLGLTLSFAVFTLFGTLILASLHLPGDTIRWLGLALLVLVGLGLLVPPLAHLLERPFSRFPQRVSGTGRNGFLLGIALGAVFVPCAGPVLAAITVAGATGHIGLRTVGLTLGFAVALDNSYDTWNAYDNQSWPAAYLIDASGRIRHVSIGEGDYPFEEQLIRDLLSAAHPGIARPGATDVPDTAPVDQNQTPETYLGAERQQFYAGGGSYATGRFTPPAKLPANSFALAGAWTIGQEAITAGQGAGITLVFHASDVYLDVGGTGMLTVSAGGASKVIQVSGAPDIYTVATGQPAQDGTGTIRLSAGLAAYSFTFG